MAKYVVTGEYVGEGVAGLLKDGGTGRLKAVTALVEGVGGRVDGLYYGVGGTDVFVVVDLPDDETAAAISLTVNSTGAVSIDVTRVLTPEELDSAIRKSPKYRAPGA